MFAVRCKLRWSVAVTAVGSSSTSLARPTLPGSPSRCLGTWASSETSRDEGEGDSSVSHRGPPKHKPVAYRYKPLAYGPTTVSYADILRRAMSTPITDSRRVLNRVRRALPPRPQDQSESSPTEDASEDASVQPEEGSLPLDHVLSRSLRFLTTSSGQIQGALSAVTEDISSDAVPDLYPRDFATIRAHHLGRWYARTLAFKHEHGAIKYYLNAVVSSTKKARNIIISNHLKSINEWLNAEKRALDHAIHEHQPELEAAVYTTVCELRAARRAHQWHKVWTLERRVASTASMFLPRTPFLSASADLLLNMDDGRLTEISMSRMAEWDDSYQHMYEEDMHTRKQMDLNGKQMNLLKRNSPIFTAKCPTTDAKELIVIRQDQSMPPTPLWPRSGSPVVLADGHTPAELDPEGMPHKLKQEIARTPSGRKWISRNKGRTGNGPRIKKPATSLTQHAS